jgi:hypothetical protein
MSMSGPLEANVLLDAEVPADQERLLMSIFGELGVTAHTRIVPPRRGVTELNWLVLVALPLQAFLGNVGSKFADDAYRGLKALVGQLVHGDRPAPAGQRPMVLRDEATGLELVLEADLPDEGYRQLFGLDLSQFQVGPVHYDRHRRRWRSERDEAELDG